MDWITHSEPRPLAEKILAVPQFKARYQRYLDTIARQVINPGFIFPHIDSLKSLIYDAAVADSYRSLDYGYTIVTFSNGYIQTVDGHTPYGIKPFLTARYSSILQQLPANSVDEKGKSDILVLVYPNPAYEFITLRALPSEKDRQGFIQDILGRQQKSFVVPANQAECIIPVSDLTPGVYNLVILNHAGFLARKFIKR